MSTLISTATSAADRIFREQHKRVCIDTERVIIFIMCLQWPAAVAAALWLSPRSWVATTDYVHPHLLAAIFLGGAFTLLPVFMAALMPANRATRHVVAACQMLMSGLLIHLTGGRIETHFHVFVSLALLAFYLDWQILITATLVTVIDHAGMAAFSPNLIYGSTGSVVLRTGEHGLWVVFCIVFLIRSCTRNLAGIREIAERESLLLHQTRHDDLTGLPNRIQLHEQLDHILQPPVAPGTEFALMALDLDRFKEVNDTLGHHAGDDLLLQVGKRIRHQLRAADTLIRMGGDEFVIVLPACDADLAPPIAERLLDTLSTPFTCAGNTVNVSASIGICLFPDSGDDAESLLRNADMALYKVKSRGRNGYQLFDLAMREEVALQRSVEHRLRRAISNNEFEIHYQPLVDIAGDLQGFEALLRWNDPHLGRIAPNDFIPFAEQCGLIVPIGEWVMRNACKQAAMWYSSGHTLKKMSVNVSAVQLASKGFVSMVISALREAGLKPELLDLELTETVIIENCEQARDQLFALRNLGVRISIDDFGVGYSSLGYLRSLPIDTIKIDRHFVNDIERSSDGRSLIEGIITMAHSLDLQVVAEGVENGEQLQILSGAGCDEIQGFYISRPLALADANVILDNGRYNLMPEAGDPTTPLLVFPSQKNADGNRNTRVSGALALQPEPLPV